MPRPFSKSTTFLVIQRLYVCDCDRSKQKWAWHLLSNSGLPKNTSLAIITNMQLNLVQDCMNQDEKNTKWRKSRHNMLQRKRKKKKLKTFEKGQIISSASVEDRINVADFSIESLAFTSKNLLEDSVSCQELI